MPAPQPLDRFRTEILTWSQFHSYEAVLSRLEREKELKISRRTLTRSLQQWGFYKNKASLVRVKAPGSILIMSNRSLIVTSPDTGVQVIRCSDDRLQAQLVEKCSTADMEEAAEIVGHDVEIWAGRLTEHQLKKGRPSYIKALLVASRGSENVRPCNKCRRRCAPYTKCVSLAGFWGGACSNCIHPDHTARCGYYDENAARPQRTNHLVEEASRVEELAEEEE